MDLVFGFIFISIGTLTFYIYLLAANEKHKDELSRYKNQNLKIKTNIKEQQQRVFNKHNSTIKAERVKR